MSIEKMGSNLSEKKLDSIESQETLEKMYEDCQKVLNDFIIKGSEKKPYGENYSITTVNIKDGTGKIYTVDIEKGEQNKMKYEDYSIYLNDLRKSIFSAQFDVSEDYKDNPDPEKMSNLHHVSDSPEELRKKLEDIEQYFS